MFLNLCIGSLLPCAPSSTHSLPSKLPGSVISPTCHSWLTLPRCPPVIRLQSQLLDMKILPYPCKSQDPRYNLRSGGTSGARSQRPTAWAALLRPIWRFPLMKRSHGEAPPFPHRNMFPYYQVQGWGKNAPFACFQLQKRAKKCKASETSNNCQFCLDVLPSLFNSIAQEAKTTGNQSKSEGEFTTDAIADTASGKGEISTHSSKSNCCSTMYGINMEILTSCTVQTFQGEMKNLTIKKKNTVWGTWMMWKIQKL